MGTTTKKRSLGFALALALSVGASGVLPSAVTAQVGGSYSARKTSDNLVKRGRDMLQQNNLELATWYLEKAEKLNVEYDGIMSKWKDSPAKLRADLNKAIAAQANGRPAVPPTPEGNLPPGPPPVSPSVPSQTYQPSELPLPVPSSVSNVPARPTPSPIGAEANLEPNSINQENGVVNRLTDDSKTRALRYLTQARQALQKGNQIAALGYYRACLSCNARFDLTDGDSPQRLAIDLRNAGVDPTQFQSQQLATAAKPIVPSTSPAPSSDHWEQKRGAAVQKLAEATAAMDRGDLKGAEKLALEAQDLRVPDEAFASKDKRPWMVLMEISRRQSRTTPATKRVDSSATDGTKIQLTAGEATVEPNIEAVLSEPVSSAIDASILSQSPGPLPTDVGELLRAETLAPIKKAPVRENVAQLREVPSNVPTQIISPPPAASSETVSPLPSRRSGAQHLFEQGEIALKDHNTERAWRLFVEAWQNQEELDASTRDKLQGYLQSFAASTAEDEDDSSRLSVPSIAGATDQERAVLSRFIGEVTREQAAIRRLRETRPDEAWERLKMLRQKVADAEIAESAKDRLITRVDRTLLEMEAFIAENRPMIENDARNREVLAEIDRRRKQRTRNQQQLAESVEQFNRLMDQQRYPEAEVVARKAREIDPTSPVTQNMIWKTQFARQMVSSITRSERFSDRWGQHHNGLLDDAIPFPDDIVQEFPDAREWIDMTEERKRMFADKQKRYTEVELEIQQSLKKMVDVNFDGEPLYTVLDSLAKMAGINVFLDPAGLDAHGVTRETPVSLELRKPVSLKSALNLILEPLELSYIIQDEVLRVTSELVRDGDVYTKPYNVADLVIPIPNFAPSYDMGLPGAIREAHNTAASSLAASAALRNGNGNQPFVVGASPEGATDVPASASALAQLGQSGVLDVAGASGYNNNPNGFGPGGPGGGSQADFDTLIELITTTVDPDTWEELGGSGTLSGFPTNLSLVVSQTQEVHEKIADLLAQLRRLQDLQVTIEVRFITLNDDFFERIGVDFDFEVDDNTGLTANEADRLTGSQGNFDDSGPSVTIGLDPISNLPRADLDLRFDQGSFGATQPTFGGYDVNSAANIGFAILSDIEAFFVIEAAQGDTRSNVLQAPKVTLFNGQQAFVSDASQRPFVTSVIPVVGDFAAAHQPVITVLTEGTSLSVQAVVTNDRRFVRLTLVPFFSRIGDVDTFQFNGRTDSDTGTNSLDPSDEGSTVQDNIRTINEGTTVQLPTFAFTTVNTTVSVPDGGTILLGGIKRLSEGRNEAGVPVLSKLPYVNRLFRNVGIGRETSSLMMMVTPRIIIQEEEEANVLGGISGN